MKKYKYKFSVVIPVYEVEKYLEETVESVLNQSIGFKENIQIILVNDGSPDDSESICLKYRELYPENVVYVKQKNAGVSAARNKGIEYIEGKYVSFLDSDDKWDKDVFEKAYKMFEKNDDIDIIGVRQHYFEASDRYPSLDFKFDKDKIVDIFNDYNHIQLSVTSGLFRESAIGDIRYDTRVKYSEDAKFINEIIIKKCKLGIISSSVHWYRKRASENSAIQTKAFKDDWYLVTPELCYKHAFELSKKKFGYVIPYFQFYIGYEYQWRLRVAIPDGINSEVLKEYFEISKELFSELDDSIFFENIYLTPDLKMEYLKIKYGDSVYDNLKYNKHTICYNNLVVYNFAKKNILDLNIFEVKDNKIILKGLVNFNIPLEDYELFLVINGKKRIKLELNETKIGPQKVFDYIYNYKKGFSAIIDDDNVKQLHFLLVYKGLYETEINFSSGGSAKVSSRTRIYYVNNGKIYFYRNKRIVVNKASLKNKIYFSLRNFKFNVLKRQWGVIFIRILYVLFKLFKRKDIWIISDRQVVANDNGYALFKYIKDNKKKAANYYFVISKDSNDFDKVKKTGKYLIYDSLKYKIYFMLADKIISSQADAWTTNPFGKKHNYYHDLYNADFIFLQHGIINNDLSVWLNQYEKNIKLFVTSAKREYDSIITGKYGFDSDVVKLTGLARYDLLDDDREKLILIMPTWRCGLVSGNKSKNVNFSQSEYCSFYNKLISDERLLDVMRKKGYKGLFVPHPRHDDNKDDFYGNDIIEILKDDANYSDLFSKGSLLVSDYSSVLFDFAYLNKPVLYAQFDREDFFQQQIYDRGYFDYENDGLGPVLFEYEEIVQKIISYLNNDCKLEKKYSSRIKDFYFYYDKNNCQRIYDEILKLNDK